MIKKVTKKWKTRNGTKIRICDMTDEHIINSIHLLESLDRSMRRSAYALLDSFNPESEAYFQLENQLLSDLEENGESVEDRFPIYYDLNLELERRKEDEKKG